ncbi:MAG: DUF4396 domain-containing protein [Allosphingosinicella sp.]
MASHHHHGHGGSAFSTSAHATLHCLTGCVIGEVVGLAIGVELGFGNGPTAILATLLSYVSGFALGLRPVMRGQGLSFGAALKLIWIGEAVSIGVMELVMNLVDWRTGGMGSGSALSWPFWRGLLFALPAGFVTAWPVNYWLLRRGLRAGH